MTISSLINENDYIGSDSTDTFSYTFKIFLNTDLLVTQRDDTNIETVLVLDADYTVTDAGETDGGTIVLTAGNLATNYALSILRVRPFTQLTDLRNLGDSFPDALEKAYDHQIMLLQFVNNNIGRAMQIPNTTTNFDTELPEPDALKLIRINAAGTGFEYITAADISATITAVDASLTLAGSTLSVTNPLLFAGVGGTVDAITASVTPAPASLTNNLRVYLEASGQNATTTPSLDLNGLGAKTIVKGSDFPLRAGDIPGANARIDLVFDASLDKWVLLNPALMEDAADKAVHQSGGYSYAVASGAVNVLVAALTPTLLAYTAGMEVTIKINNANTVVAPTLNIDTLGAKTIKHKDGAALAIGDLPLNYEARLEYNGTDFLFQNPQQQVIGVSGVSRNLVIIPNSGTPLTQLDIDADEIMLIDTNGRGFLATAVNLTNDSAGTGLNGMDTGTLGASTIYYIWVISNGTTVGSLVSLQSTHAGILTDIPTGYTFVALVGALITNGSSQFIPFRQEGKRFDLDAYQIIKDGSFSTLAWTAQSLATFVPPNAKRIRTIFGVDADLNNGISPRSDGHAGQHFRADDTATPADCGGTMPTVRNAWVALECRYASSIYYFTPDAGSTLVLAGWDF